MRKKTRIEELFEQLSFGNNKDKTYKNIEGRINKNETLHVEEEELSWEELGAVAGGSKVNSEDIAKKIDLQIKK